MNAFTQNLTNWWQQFETRQQRILVYAAPIIILLLLYLLLQPLFSHYQQSKQSFQSLRTSYQWLAEQPALETSAPSSCRHLSLLNDSTDFQQVLNQQLSDKQVLNPQWQQQSEGWLLNLQEVDGSQLLVWLEQATCQGVVLKAIDLKKQPSSRLNASIELVVL